MSTAKVIVITHGKAAEDMVDAVERVVGKLDVRTINVQIGEPRAETESQIERVVDDLRADEVLFLTDLEGSTPYNLCCKRCGGDRHQKFAAVQFWHGNCDCRRCHVLSATSTRTKKTGASGRMRLLRKWRPDRESAFVHCSLKITFTVVSTSTACPFNTYGL